MLAAPIVEPRVAKSVAAATSASGAAITYDIGHLRPPRDADRRAARSPADNLLERSLSLSGKHVRGFPKVLAAFRPHAGDLVFLGDRRRLEDVRNTMALRWRPGAHQAR